MSKHIGLGCRGQSKDNWIKSELVDQREVRIFDWVGLDHIESYQIRVCRYKCIRSEQIDRIGSRGSD